MPCIEIMDGETVINTIIATEEFAEAQHPGAWRLAAVQPDQTAPAEPQAPEWAWYLDTGPFTDRLGSASAAIDTSTLPGLVAIRGDFARRKWIDLKDPRVIGAVWYLAGQAHPVLGTLSQPLISPEVAAAALATKPVPAENLALRKLYFS